MGNTKCDLSMATSALEKLAFQAAAAEQEVRRLHQADGQLTPKAAERRQSPMAFFRRLNDGASIRNPSSVSSSAKMRFACSRSAPATAA